MRAGYSRRPELTREWQKPVISGSNEILSETSDVVIPVLGVRVVRVWRVRL